jgi:hypothetical protein
MDNLSRQSLSALVFLMATVGVVCAQKEFTLLTPEVVVASKELADELRSLSCPEANDTWVPTNSQVLEGFGRLHTKEGTAEIVASAIGGIDMGPSLKLVSLSRYQVFGLILDNRKQILYDASPKPPALENSETDRWLKQIISVRTQDGGLVYWWALYDVESGRFVASRRRP